MRLGVRHSTRIIYSSPVSEEVIETRLGPYSDADQRWERFDLRVRPRGLLRPFNDAFGNAVYLITLVGPHDFIEMVTEGTITTSAGDPYALPREPVRPLTPLEQFDCLRPSRLVPSDPTLADLATPHVPDNAESHFEATAALSHATYGMLAYTPRATDTTTTAVEPLSKGQGVCQDYTHVLIGLCRALGIPARYVSGYLLTPATSAAATTQSASGRVDTNARTDAGASHAWVEAFSPTHGWRGFDPTHDLLVDDNYVKMAMGRDYADVPPTRGVFRGASQSTLTVDVTTRPLG